MLAWLLHLNVQDISFLVTVGALALAAMLALILRRPTRRWMITASVAVTAGAGLGVLLAWLAGDVWDLFGAQLSITETLWVSLVFAGLGLAAVNLWRSRWWRKLIAVATVPLVIVTGCAFVNADIGYYTDVSDALGMPQYKNGPLGHEHGDPQRGAVAVVDTKTWRPPADMPKSGMVLSAAIPGTVSRFAARDAVIYLPPAAQVADPPALPVIIALSGQPGSPSDWFASGHIAQVMDAYAAAHKGIAPIVVSPDQLGPSSANTMCVDSSLGDSATYITTDVVDWVTTHLYVATNRDAWSLLGFSQGATCSSQFLAGDAQRFGSMLAVSSEIGPMNGPDTVAQAFHGSQAAYAAAMPIAKMRAHGTYRDTLAVFAVGGEDSRYVAWDEQLHAVAQGEGMNTQLYVSPGTGHDWYTVAYGVQKGLPAVLAHMGIG
ncbi:alpha/beta hydrolase-fold protein [Humibacter antri]